MKESIKIATGKTEPRGWLSEMLRRDLSGITGNLDKLNEDAASDVFGAGKLRHSENGYWSTWWAGETRGNWLEGFVRAAFLLGDEKFISRAKAEVDVILDNQDKDGYIGIYEKDCRYLITDRFGEFWTQSRVLRVLLAYYEFTKDKRTLNALYRAADSIVTSLDNADGSRKSLFEIPDTDGSKGHSLMIIELLYELYKLSKYKRYRDFAEYLYADFNAHASKFPGDDMRFCNLLDESVPLISHGPHVAEQSKLLVMLYSMTGKKEYLEAYKAAMRKIALNLSLSGSLKSDEMVGVYDQYAKGEIDLSTKPMGGCVPLASAGYEYCSTVEYMLSCEYGQEILGDKTFADSAEWTAYNAALAAKSADCKTIQYISADNMYDGTKEAGARYDYSPTHDDAACCCAPNAARCFPLFMRGLYGESGKGLVISMYAPSYFKSEKLGVTIETTTNYPFENDISYLIDGGKCELRFRIPKWAEDVEILVDGKITDFATRRGYAIINKTWANTSLTIRFMSTPKLLRSVNGERAIAFGALLYAYDIPSQWSATRAYALNDFSDYDVNILPHVSYDYTLLLKNGRLKRYEKTNYETADYPLENGYRLLVSALDNHSAPRLLELKPIGCTTLRRTTFPVYEDARNLFSM